MIKDLNGYVYKIILQNLLNNNKMKPCYIHKSNPYTCDNIKKYLLINNFNVELLSDKYISNTTPMLWKCKCGNSFNRSWSHIMRGSISCCECAKKKTIESHLLDKNIIKNTLQKYGYYLINNNDYIDATNDLYIYDKDMYKYKTTYTRIKQGKIPSKISRSNPYSIDNINNYLKIHRNGEYICISTKYISNTASLEFVHVPCGTKFESNWSAIRGKVSDNGIDKYYKQCPYCNVNKVESIHASVLKQVFLKEYPDTQLEDRSCINPKTNYVLPTDIVNHKLKMAIEIQSNVHDAINQKSLDKIKREYWINRGYKFYDPDIRNYSILQIIQLFFPHIKSIPSYINYNFSNCIDFNLVQNLLNHGLTIPEISNMTGIKRGSIYALKNAHKIIYPQNYINNIRNIRPIIRLSKHGKYIKRYNSLNSVKQDGFWPGPVNQVLKGKQKYSYDSFWVYEDDYLNNNYQISV